MFLSVKRVPTHLTDVQAKRARDVGTKLALRNGSDVYRLAKTRGQHSKLQIRLGGDITENGLMVEGDTDGDGVADLLIAVDGLADHHGRRRAVKVRILVVSGREERPTTTRSGNLLLLQGS